jgi:hypothetical protein
LKWCTKTIELLNSGLGSDGGYFDFSFKQNASNTKDTWYSIEIMKCIDTDTIQNKNMHISFVNDKRKDSSLIDTSHIIDICDYIKEISSINILHIIT